MIKLCHICRQREDEIGAWYCSSGNHRRPERTAQTHYRSDGKPCDYMAIDACNKCGWLKAVDQCPNCGAAMVREEDGQVFCGKRCFLAHT